MSANFKIGLLPNSIQNLQGMARHMVDLIRRDVDIISTETKKSKREPYKENGEIVTVGIFDEIEKLIPVLEKPGGPDIIFVNSNNDVNNIKFEISDRNQHRLSKRKQLWFGNYMNFASKTGHIHKIPVPITEHSISHYLEKYAHKEGTENTIDIDNLKDGVLKSESHAKNTVETLKINNDNKPTNEESSVIQQEQPQKTILDQKLQPQNIVGEHTIEKEPPPTLQIHPQSKSVPTSSKTIIWLINERLGTGQQKQTLLPPPILKTESQTQNNESSVLNNIGDSKQEMQVSEIESEPAVQNTVKNPVPKQKSEVQPQPATNTLDKAWSFSFIKEKAVSIYNSTPSWVFYALGAAGSIATVYYGAPLLERSADGFFKFFSSVPYDIENPKIIPSYPSMAPINNMEWELAEISIED